jgi:Fe-S-cluster containining protein
MLGALTAAEWRKMGLSRRVLETVRVMHHSVEVADNALRSLLKRGEDVQQRHSTCRECRMPWCCNQIVYATVVEAMMLTKCLGNTKWDSREGASNLMLRGREQMAVTPKEWFEKNIPCPFLDRGRCSVYAYRPLACRRYYVWTSTEPHGCSPEEFARGTQPREMATTELLRGTMPVYHKLQDLWGIGYAVGPLPLVVGLVAHAAHVGLDLLPSIVNEARVFPPKSHMPLALLWPGVEIVAKRRKR